MSKLWGEKAMPSTGFDIMKQWMAVDLNDFRKCSYPVPILNNASIILGMTGVGGPLYTIVVKKQNASAAMYRTFFLATLGVWSGYYFTRAFNQYYFGKFKFSLEYAMMRKGDFKKTIEPTKYGDPEFLKKWKPVRSY
ncbi:uncharacterized protein LOC100175877 [Ciona intestinalis]